MEILAPLIWIYVIVNLFLVNLDLLVVERAPVLDPLFRYRLLLGTLFLVLAVRFWRKKGFLLPLTFLVFYPGIVLFVRFPLVVYRRRSWTLALAFAHAVFGLVLGFRRAAYAWAATLIVFILAATDATWTLAGTGIMAFTLMLYSILALLVQALRPFRYLSVQANIYSERLADIDKHRLDPRLRAMRRQELREEHVKEIVEKATGLALHYYGGRFWRHKLDEYRKSPAPLMAAVMMFAWTMVSLGILASVVNYSISRIDPSQYDHDGLLTVLRIIYYSYGSFAFAEVGGVTPQGALAITVALCTGILGVLGLSVIVLSVILATFSKDDRSGEQAIEKFDAATEGLAELARIDYSMEFQDVLSWLQRQNVPNVGLALFFVKGTPGVDEPSRRPPPRAPRPNPRFRRRDFAQ